jgi:hypothetical protein
MKFPAKLWVVIGIAFITSCNNSTSTRDHDSPDSTFVEEVEETAVAPDVQKYFPELFTYFHSQDSSFSANAFEGGEMELSDSLPTTKIDSFHLVAYTPFLVFNYDSSLAVDFVSYNYVISKKAGKTYIEQGGPDTEVALLNFKNQSRTRILFLGTAGTVLEAKWENNHSILLAVAEEVPGGEIKPSIWRYDLTNKRMEFYTYKDTINANIKNYTEEKLNTRIKTILSF